MRLIQYFMKKVYMVKNNVILRNVILFLVCFGGILFSARRGMGSVEKYYRSKKEVDPEVKFLLTAMLNVKRTVGSEEVFLFRKNLIDIFKKKIKGQRVSPEISVHLRNFVSDWHANLDIFGDGVMRDAINLFIRFSNRFSKRSFSLQEEDVCRAVKRCEAARALSPKSA